MRPQPLRRGIPLHFLLNRLRQLGDRRVQVVQQLQQVDSRSATGSLYINRFPSAALTPRIVRSPSFSLRFVPHEVKLPEIAVKILAADIVVNADNPALHKCMAAFGWICVNVATRIFAGAHGSQSRVLENLRRDLYKPCTHPGSRGPTQPLSRDCGLLWVEPT